MIAKRWIWLVGMGLVGAIALTNCQEIAQLAAPSYEAQLATYLSNSEAKMYGAYWCPHCARQKHLFGEAAQLIPYVECDPRGANAKVEFCNTVGISAYPTWQINGEFYLGTQPLKRLAILSGFEQGSRPSDTNSGEWGGFSPAP
ncbi:MAG: glutaredoxin family protein [Leptolyngbyaceae cyanobacterium]